MFYIHTVDDFRIKKGFTYYRYCNRHRFWIRLFSYVCKLSITLPFGRIAFGITTEHYSVSDEYDC